MAIVAADLVSPVGDVDGAVWFPVLTSGEVLTLLTGYITDAYTRTDDDDAARQWSYYRAASSVADRLATTATSKTLTLVDQGSKSETVSAGQFAYWAAKAAAYLAAFTAEDADVTDDPLGGYSVLASLRHG